MLGALVIGCAQPQPPDAAFTAPTLRGAFEGAFLVGAALNAAQFSDQDTLGAAIVKAQFNSITSSSVIITRTPRRANASIVESSCAGDGQSRRS